MADTKKKELQDNSQFQYHYEEDLKYIQKTQLKNLLEDLVKDVIDVQPENIYTFMQQWATTEEKKIKELTDYSSDFSAPPIAS